MDKNYVKRGGKMKKLYGLLFALILLFVKPNYPQSDSVLSYLPLDIGNQWQYRVHYVVNNSNIDTTYYSLFTVVRDTIMPNGFQYQVLESESETKYIHIDSSIACVYEYEYDLTQGLKTDSLRCSEGDWFGQNIYCELIDTATILDYNTWIMVIDRPWPDISERHTLAMDIGIAYQEIITTYSYGTTKTSTLVYAYINGNEFGEKVTSVNDLSNRRSKYTLHQNYPNPFNPSTTIRYQIPEFSFITLKVYDVLGNDVAILLDEERLAGSYELEFSAKGGSVSSGNAYNLPSGIYFYKLIAGSYIETKKMILIK
jgi:hypothetical protein